MSTYYPDHVFFQHDHDDLPQPRNCSVKGCSKPLPNGYMLKMCEACRGRHRVYASTKRAKRKLEKLAVIHSTISGGEEGPAQTVGWMPPDEPSPPPPSQHDTISEEPLPESEVSAYFPPASWSQIDPRLFNPTSSELAGALTLPPIDPQRSPTPEPAPSPAPSTSAHPVESSSSGLPPRYCSVKGCKAIMSGDYLFKMCQSCRDRYRVYGNTKRNKWKREREVASATLERIRDHQDQRREEIGLPPMSTLSPADSERRAWEDSVITSTTVETSQVAPPERTASTSASGSASPAVSSTSALPLRMCTVSHCHAILPSTYEFRRCEQHRLQNRHHSKLKRVRDKEHKAVAPPAPELPDPPAELHEPSEPQIPAGLTSTFHSARTSHTCTLKHCANLLPPHTPWKMCDMHREKDREQRRRKAERDRAVKAAMALAPAAGVEAPSGEPSTVPVPEDEGDSAEPQPSDMPMEMPIEEEEEEEAFMEPLLPPDDYADPASAPAHTDVSPVAPSSASSSSSEHAAVQEIVSTITASTESPPAKKRKTATTATATATTTTTHTPAPQTHPHFQVPYYMPPPYSMSYPPGAPPFYAPHAHALPYPPFGGPFPSFVPWGIPGVAYPPPVPTAADKAKDEEREKEAREKDKERTKEKARERAKERRDRKRAERGLQIVMVDPARRRESALTPSPSPAPAAKRCGAAGCTRAVVGGMLCERCRARLKRRQERVKVRLRLEKRRAGGSAQGVSVVG